MAKVEDCPGFETFGADVKAAREAKRLARKTLAEMVGIEWRYLANIENQGAIPSLPVMIQLIKVCGLPVERYFNPEIIREESEQRQRVSHKLKLCPEEYLLIIEGAIDGALKMEQTAKQKDTMILRAVRTCQYQNIIVVNIFLLIGKFQEIFVNLIQFLLQGQV